MRTIRDVQHFHQHFLRAAQKAQGIDAYPTDEWLLHSPSPDSITKCFEMGVTHADYMWSPVSKGEWSFAQRQAYRDGYANQKLRGAKDTMQWRSFISS